MFSLLDSVKGKALKYYEDLKTSLDENVEPKDENKIEAPENEDYQELYKTFSKVTSTLKSTLKDTAKVIKTNIEDNPYLNEFNNMQKNFEEQTEKERLKENELWAGHPKEEILRKQILALSQDSRNFLRSPPDGCDFVFDFHQNAPFAKCMLKNDPKLAIMRFKLVPTKVKEEVFWRNYFYRVSLIKHSINLYEGLDDSVKVNKSTVSKQEPIQNVASNTRLTPDIVYGDLDEEDDDNSSVPIEFISDNLIGALNPENDQISPTTCPKNSSNPSITHLDVKNSNNTNEKNAKGKGIKEQKTITNTVKGEEITGNTENKTVAETKADAKENSTFIIDEDEIEKMLEEKEFEMIKSATFDDASEDWDEEMQEMLEKQKI